MTSPIVLRVMTERVARGDPFLIGEVNGPAGDRLRPLEGQAGKKLAELAGLSFEDYLKTFARANLLSRFEGVDENGVALLDSRSARGAAEHVMNRLNHDYWYRQGSQEPLPAPARLILLGRRVAAAFYLEDDRPWFEWTPMAFGPPGCRVAVMPHPLGSTAWWESSENVDAAREFFKKLLAQQRASLDASSS